jgi:four helix bundle protein
MFDALVVARALVAQLRLPAERIAARDADLARQLRRAATSIPFNIAEGRCRGGKDKPHLYRVAAGSAAELTEALHVAVAWGHVEAAEVAEALADLDRVRAMLWQLTR